MVREIDFLKSQREIEAQKAQSSRTLKVGGVVVLLFYCLLTIIVFAFWWRLVKKSQNLEQTITAQKQRITQFRDAEVLQLIFKQRLGKVNQVFSQPKLTYESLLSFLEQNIPSGLDLEKLELEEGGLISFSGKAANAVILSQFLESLNNYPFKKVTLISSLRDQNGEYSFSLSLEENNGS